MSYAKACALAVVGAVSLAAAQSAQAVTLKELIDSNAVITVGDKVYSNWGLVGYNQPAGSGATQTTQMPPENIAVSFVLGSQNNVPPAAVQFGAGWNTAFGANGNVDSVISYDLTAINNTAITGVGLDIGGVANINGGVVHVGETVTDISGGTPGATQNLNVYMDGPGGLADSQTATLNLGVGATKLHIVKDINVTAPSGQAFAAVTFVENTYQTGPGQGTPPGPIPEPMSLALLPLAIVGLGLRKKLAR